MGRSRPQSDFFTASMYWPTFRRSSCLGFGEIEERALIGVEGRAIIEKKGCAPESPLTSQFTSSSRRS